MTLVFIAWTKIGMSSCIPPAAKKTGVNCLGDGIWKRDRLLWSAESGMVVVAVAPDVVGVRDEAVIGRVLAG